jgi:hypothetical protein
MILSGFGLAAFVILLAHRVEPHIKRVPPEQAIIREIVADDIRREVEREEARECELAESEADDSEEVEQAAPAA